MTDTSELEVCDRCLNAASCKRAKQCKIEKDRGDINSGDWYSGGHHAYGMSDKIPRHQTLSQMDGERDG